MSLHPFSPSADGKTCNEMLYPERKRCDKGPGDETHTGTRPKPPELEFPYPPCSLCGKVTFYEDDCFRCTPCGAHWPSQTGPGSWDDPTLPVCGATREPFDRDDLDPRYEGIRHHADYCIRERDHEPPHRADQYSVWSEVAR